MSNFTVYFTQTFTPTNKIKTLKHDRRMKVLIEKNIHLTYALGRDAVRLFPRLSLRHHVPAVIGLAISTVIPAYYGSCVPRTAILLLCNELCNAKRALCEKHVFTSRNSRFENAKRPLLKGKTGIMASIGGLIAADYIIFSQ